jgi:hypothetical protein
VLDISMGSQALEADMSIRQGAFESWTDGKIAAKK